MQTAVYRFSLSRGGAKFRLFAGYGMMVLAILFIVLSGFRAVYLWQTGDLARLSGIDFLIFSVTLAAMLIVILANVQAVRPAGNFMTLDESGLTYVRLGVRRRWAWRDLLEFGVTVHFDGTKAVEFRPPPASGWRANLGSWAVWMAGGWFARGGRIIRIPDKYDAPLKDIAATLNEYRARAPGGGDLTDDPHRPEPA